MTRFIKIVKLHIISYLTPLGIDVDVSSPTIPAFTWFSAARQQQLRSDGYLRVRCATTYIIKQNVSISTRPRKMLFTIYFVVMVYLALWNKLYIAFEK